MAGGASAQKVQAMSSWPGLDEHQASCWVNHNNHDTISMVAMSDNGHLAAGSSSNGASHKVRQGLPGRGITTLRVKCSCQC